MTQDNKISEMLPKCSPLLSGEHKCQSPFVPACISASSNITLSYDWIQFSGIAVELDLQKLNPFLFNIQKLEYGSRFFNNQYKIECIVHGETMHFANIEINPRPSFLDPNLVLVKLANRFNYSPGLADTIKSFCREFRISFKRYCRIDYAIDFQKVEFFGENMQALIHAFATRQLKVKGKGFSIHSSVKEYDGITWGKRSSGLSITLYNKSKEMRKKGVKPWIEDLWKSANFSPSAETFRLEFSTTPPRFDVTAKDEEILSETEFAHLHSESINTGETYGTYYDIEFLNMFNEHVNFLYTNFFVVAKTEPGKRFSRCQSYEPLNLFDNPSIFRPQAICVKAQGSNMKKSIVKNMVMEAVFLQKKDEKIRASYMWELVQEYVERYSIELWFNKIYEGLNVERLNMTPYEYMTGEQWNSRPMKQAKFL